MFDVQKLKVIFPARWDAFNGRKVAVDGASDDEQPEP